MFTYDTLTIGINHFDVGRTIAVWRNLHIVQSELLQWRLISKWHHPRLSLDCHGVTSKCAWMAID